MITCRLQGGLGNQMFQIAATHALALRNKDVSGFNLNRCWTPLQGNSSNNYKNNILSKINDISTLAYTPRLSFSEPQFSYYELPYAPDLELNGYFQSEKYFSDFKQEIINLFNIDTEYKKIVSHFIDKIQAETITSIHIRRGDYLNNPSFHPTCSIDYYDKAMKMFPNSKFIFISDDMNWVKDNFKGANIIYFDLGSEILDLTLMTMCHNNIIANSSFSWWGAYLNQNPNKIVIAPKEWFGPNGPKDQGDIIPESWITI